MLQEETSVKPTNNRLKTYTGQPMNVVGEILVDVCHNKLSEKLPLVVVAEKGPPLMGRTWLRKINVDWKTVGAIRVTREGVEKSLKRVLAKYAEVFKEELGTVKSVHVSCI